MSKLYVGIDPSMTSTGLIILDENYDMAVMKIISSDIKDLNEVRIQQIGREILLSLNRLQKDIEMVCLEGISFGSSGRGVAQQAGLNYYISILLIENNYDYMRCEPTKLKKFVTGKGQCKKDLMLMKTFKKWGVEFDNSDLCDAYGLARYGKDFEE